jgi:hypothetical protein
MKENTSFSLAMFALILTTFLSSFAEAHTACKDLEGKMAVSIKRNWGMPNMINKFWDVELSLEEKNSVAALSLTSDHDHEAIVTKDFKIEVTLDTASDADLIPVVQDRFGEDKARMKKLVESRRSDFKRITIHNRFSEKQMNENEKESYIVVCEDKVVLN